VTTGGTSTAPYSSPTQADDGTILAVRGTVLVLLRADGTSIRTLPSILTDAPAGSGGVGPFDAAIFPDGQKLAYMVGYVAMTRPAPAS